MIEVEQPAISMLVTECPNNNFEMWLTDMAILVTNILIYFCCLQIFLNCAAEPFLAFVKPYKEDFVVRDT